VVSEFFFGEFLKGRTYKTIQSHKKRKRVPTIHVDKANPAKNTARYEVGLTLVPSPSFKEISVIYTMAMIKAKRYCEERVYLADVAADVPWSIHLAIVVFVCVIVS
jgi:hypothetical protein